MPRHFNFPPIRPTLITLGALFIGHHASAEVYSAANDPFVIRTINHGEEMSNNSFSQNSLSHSVDDFQWFNLPRSVQMVIFPPAPPALGEELPLTNNAGMIPPSLGDFAREVFYGKYAISRGLTKLSTKEIERFAAYRKTRQTLIDEIQLKFAELSAAMPIARTAELNKLAARQEEPLRTLAAEAESIRNDLVRTVSFNGFNFPATNVTSRDGGGWTSSSLHLGSASQSPTFIREFANLFSAAYYDDGLSTEQRLLLPEIAYTQQASSNEKTSEAVAVESAYVYFLPATARIRLPANLPASLEEKIHAFTSEKESLKSELRNAVLRENYFFTWRRSHQLAVLAEQQAPRFQALETLAEEIRVGLAGFDYPGQPAPVELPLDLTQRVGNFYTRKVEVQRELLNRLRSLRSEFPTARFDIARQGDGLIIVQTTTGAKGAAGLTEFNASLVRRYAAFASESEILRRDIQRYNENSPNRVARTVDQLAADFKRAYAAHENWNRYRDYYRAVLVPGLSPAQRRLLFQAAAAELDQAGQQPQS